MKLKTFQNDEERAVVTAMVVSDRVLARIISSIGTDRQPFRSKWANLVSAWCVAYGRKFDRAPRQGIRSLFRKWAERSRDEEAVALVEKFLTGLSDDYQSLARGLNEDHVLDSAASLFNRVKIERLCEEVSADLEAREEEAARRKIVEFRPLNLSTSSVVQVLSDKGAVVDALASSEEEVMVHYPGALGQFFSSHLCRDGLVAFLAPEKRGKSFWLIDLAWRSAVLNKRRTYFYSVGDMTERQMMRRLLARAARRPIREGRVEWPSGIRRRENEEPSVRLETKDYPRPLSVSESLSAMKRARMQTSHSSSLLRMRCTPVSTTRVADIETDLEEAIREGWIPDVVVVDYADILAPEESSSRQEFRHQTNETWKAMRRLSQKYHLLVVTATQSDAASYEAGLLRRANFSEDKRKLAHVTGMVGINQTEPEKEKGVFRLNWILLREGSYLESRCVWSAGSLPLCNPAMVSTW